LRAEAGGNKEKCERREGNCRLYRKRTKEDIREEEEEEEEEVLVDIRGKVAKIGR